MITVTRWGCMFIVKRGLRWSMVPSQRDNEKTRDTISYAIAYWHTDRRTRHSNSTQILF